MYLIVVVAMCVVIGAMCMDAAFGWRKAKLRGEARTSYLFSRSITKFALYEGVLFISAGIDTLIHFVWAQFSSTTIHCVPLASILVAITLCIVEIWSMREKAEEKTRNNINHAIKVVADAISREEAVDIAKHIIDKASDKDNETE
jgi:hypothetical protein